MAKLKYFDKHRHATWLELFFDLVFVACVGTLTHHLGHAASQNLSPNLIFEFLGEFVPVWWIWASHTYYSNRFDTDSKPHRIVTLFLSFLMATMTAYLGSEAGAAHTWFVGIYALTRLLQAVMYYVTSTQNDLSPGFSSLMTRGIIGCTLVSLLSLLAPNESIFYAVILFSAIFEMAITGWITIRCLPCAIHLRHLVERVGLLSLILLGESVISLASSLRGIAWNQFNALAAVTGFTMICAIWWIYFDSFHVLERAKLIKHGFVILYSHVVFCLGLVILANLIRYAIKNEISVEGFQVLAIIGMTLFYIGKQFPYFSAFPIFRANTVINSVVCIFVTILSTLLPRPEYALVGMTLGMFFYVYSNLTWTLTKDASQYLLEPEH